MTLGVNLILGLALIGYGLYMLIRRQTAPQKIDGIRTVICATNRLDDLRPGLLNIDFASQSGNTDIDTPIEGIQSRLRERLNS